MEPGFQLPGSSSSRRSRPPACSRRRGVARTRKRLRTGVLDKENVDAGSGSVECERKRGRKEPLALITTPQPHFSPSSSPHTNMISPQCMVSSTPITKHLRKTQSQEQDSQRASFLTTPTKGSKDYLLLSNWGLPEQVLSQYSQRGIYSMFQWQAECLQLGSVLSGGNLVYSAPTSAGKTLVAELLALKCVLETRKKVIIILPFVSTAHEKVSYLRAMFEPQGVRVGGFMGNQSPQGGLPAVDMAICTIEKANSLVNRLLEERATHTLGAVVVDELHMIGDEHRGYLLELMLTKLVYAARAQGSGSESIQIIGMSATLPNIDTLAKWLRAELYQIDFRPTPLQEMVKIGPTLYDTDFKKLREFDRADSFPGDEDDILTICQERILGGHSVLIFCPTKAWCEGLATTLAEAQARFAVGGESGGPGVLNRSGLVGVCEQLRRTQVGLDHVLEKTIPGGVAFHHAGLTFEEREIVEGAFRQTLIKVLVATSTLSSGVNLPARLVIIRTPFFQRALIDLLVYKQMVGRAGRKGVDTLGESILMCKPSERTKVISLFKSSPKSIHSCLCAQVSSRAKAVRGSGGSGLAILKRALLEIIVSGVASTKEEIQLYVSCTLYSAELGAQASQEDLTAHLDTTLDFLLCHDFIFAKTTRPLPDATPITELCPTQLGVATVASSLSPDEALVLFEELRKARKNFVLENELHIIYLVTPVYIQEQWPNIDWYKYLCMWERLSPDMRHVSDMLGVRECFLAQAVQGRVSERTEAQREAQRVHRRFFTALALQDLVHEVPIRHVARQYGATKGLLQTLQAAAGTFAGMVTAFCGKLGWSNLELLLSQFQNRLTFGVERELCDLVRVSLLNGFRARVLYNAGYHTLTALASANPAQVEACLRNAVPFKSYKLAGGEGEERAEATCNTWCAKLRKGMTESEAAVSIVTEARGILSKELNVPVSAWDGQPGLLLTPSSRDKPRVPQSGVKVLEQRPTVTHSNGEASLKRDCDHKAPHTSVRKSSHQDHAAPRTSVNLDPDNLCPVLKTAPQPPYCNFTPASTLLRAPAPLPSPAPEDNQPRSMNGHALIENLSPISFPRDGLSTPAVAAPDTVQDSQEGRRDMSIEMFDSSNIELGELSPGEKFPPTIPDSLPCSADISMSFSFRTLAMIDAMCEANAANSGSVPGSRHPADTEEVGVVLAGQPHISPGVSGLHSNRLNMEQTPQRVSDTSKALLDTPSHYQPSSGLKELSSLCSSQLSQSGVTLINVTSNRALFQTFVSECLEQRRVAVAVASTGLEQNDGGIGSVVVSKRDKSDSTGISLLPLLREQVIGIAFCWGGVDVYYVSLCQDTDHSVSLSERVEALRRLFERASAGSSRGKLIGYDLKSHLKLLALSCGVMPECGSSDPLVADWMLNPDAKEKTIHKMVLQYLPDQPLLSACEEYEEVPLSSLATAGADPEMRASAESILAYMLASKLEVLLDAEGLLEPYHCLEMPSLQVLAKVELNGIGFSPEECTLLRDVLQRHVSELEQEAYGLAGHTFSLTSPEDVASVLFLELRLPPKLDPHQPSGLKRTLGTGAASCRLTKKRVRHLSTAKEVLERLQKLHPLPGVVLEWRRVSATMSKTVYPLLKGVTPHGPPVGGARIHASVQVHTATGRVSVSDPSLQMVPKEYNIGTKISSGHSSKLLSESQCLGAHSSQRDLLPTPSSVCMRDVFHPFPGGVFLTADYSQLELRVLAHMSGDAKLRQFLNGSGDVFKLIAGEWLGVSASGVTDQQRQEAKQVCYGMIYGIGPKALGEQLGVSDDQASQFMESFKCRYPAVRQFISRTVQRCREVGHVTTLLGRKRFLPSIHSTNIHARSQAERQAVNTTIQGSAADLVKTAMVNVDRKIGELYGASATCLLPGSDTARQHAAYLVLQLHDELLYEVREGEVGQVAGLVRQEMENALELSVRFPVKLKVGHSWGTLQPAPF